MHRIAVIISVFLAGCDVGSVTNVNNQQPDGNNGGVDSGSGSNGSNCEQLQTAGPGHHNAGQACIVAGCHLAGGGGPEYSYAGTVYKDAGATQPYGGATIIVTLGGTAHKLISTADGNFSITPLIVAAPGAATANTSASVCPAATSMNGVLSAATDGNCNNCHRAGGTTSPIHIP